MSRYLLLEMNDGLLDGSRLISERSILERRKPGIAFGTEQFYGLGLMVAKEQGLNMVAHDGNTLGFSSGLAFFPEKELGIVVLTNARAANAFIAAIKQKFFELTFSATPRSEEMVKNAVQIQALSVKTMNEQTSFDLADMQWMDDLIGEYHSNTLGKLIISKSMIQNSYEISSEEWSTRVGCKIEKNGEKSITLIDGPMLGAKLQVDKISSKLTLDFGQEKYCFNRGCKSEVAHLCDQSVETEQKAKSSWISCGLFGAAAIGVVAGGCVIYNQITNANKF
jgi:hypothetical protein